MYKGRFCTSGGIKAPLGYVETDPSGRYGRVSSSSYFFRNTCNYGTGTLYLNNCDFGACSLGTFLGEEQ